MTDAEGVQKEITTAVWLRGYRSGYEESNRQHKALRAWEPFLLILIAVFSGTIFGAVLYGVIAKMGLADIVGLC